VSTSLDLSPRRAWQAGRAPLGVVLLVLMAVALLALLRSGSPTGFLDPRAVDRPGSRALAEVLRDEGVRVQLARTTDEVVSWSSDDSTILLATPGLLVTEQLDRLERTGADLVLVTPEDEALEVLAPDISVSGAVDSERRRPACALPAAGRAGTTEMGGLAYEARRPDEGEAFLCYATGDSAPLAQVRNADRTVTALGDPQILTNDRLDDEGNAALAMNLLGAHETLVWYLPSLGDVPAGAQEESFYSLLPEGVGYALAMLAVALVVLAAWRMRRLGPVVPEPLPVVVRAAETVEGRARLYRRAGAADKAAATLRRAARLRLAPLAGLPRSAPPDAVVHALAARAGRAPGDVGNLLYGAAPTDDTALVTLADALDALDREVRRS
jgi:hypothetical protein